MSEPDVIAILEGMAENGHAPVDGCKLFGVGYEDAFRMLEDTYLRQRFDRMGSAEKFVVGPFGSGKTHFVRQFMEIASDLGCVTAEVSLSKDVDFTDSLIVFREVAREIRAPGRPERGMRALMLACLDELRNAAPQGIDLDQFTNAWIDGLDDGTFELESFARVAKLAFNANRHGEATVFDSACRWLGGEVSDRILSRDLSMAPVPKAEQNLHGKRAMLSMFQMTKRSGFRGTVVSFDEAEQGLSVNKTQMQRILSMLQSGINAMADLKGGAGMVVYALTPDLVEQIRGFAALQQRTSDPAPDESFWDGNELAPMIDLSHRGDPVKELRAIGHRLADMLYERTESDVRPPKEVADAEVDRLADEVDASDASVSSRRLMVRRTCKMLLDLHNKGLS